MVMRENRIDDAIDTVEAFLKNPKPNEPLPAI